MIYDFKATTIDGKILDFSIYKGKLILIVNTASIGHYSHQFIGLEKLHEEYKDRGLVVIGFPSGQFANHEFDTGKEILEFCQSNYGVTFQLMEKVEVNGEKAHPIFKYLLEQTKGIQKTRIKWDFTKFLISPDGNAIKKFPPAAQPKELKGVIENMLNSGK